MMAAEASNFYFEQIIRSQNEEIYNDYEIVHGIQD